MPKSLVIQNSNTVITGGGSVRVMRDGVLVYEQQGANLFAGDVIITQGSNNITLSSGGSSVVVSGDNAGIYLSGSSDFIVSDTLVSYDYSTSSYQTTQLSSLTEFDFDSIRHTADTDHSTIIDYSHSNDMPNSAQGFSSVTSFQQQFTPGVVVAHHDYFDQGPFVEEVYASEFFSGFDGFDHEFDGFDSRYDAFSDERFNGFDGIDFFESFFDAFEFFVDGFDFDFHDFEHIIITITENSGDGDDNADDDSPSNENTTVTLTIGDDEFVLGSGNDVFTSSSANFGADDVLTGNAGTDTLIFTDQVAITIAKLAEKTGIDVIVFEADGNTVVFSDAFINASDDDSVELNNDEFTVTSLDTSNVDDERTLVIGGTGTVTLADGEDSAVTLKDDVDVTIISGSGSDTITGGSGADTITLGTGDDTVTGGSGDDSFTVARSALTTDDDIDGEGGTDTLTLTGGGSITLTSDFNAQLSNIETLAVAAGSDYTLTLNSGYDAIVGIDGSNLGSGNALTVSAGSNEEDLTITGGSGDDTIALGTGTNTVTGGGGADTVTLSSGTDDVTLGSGNDSVTVALSNLTTADSIDMVSGTDALTVTGGGTKTFSSSFNSQLSNIDSLVTASGGDYTLTMGASYTAITTIDGSGLGSGDVLTVDLSSNSGNFTVTGGAAADSVTLGSGTDTVTLGAGADTFTSASANFKQADDLSGGDDTDTLAFTDQVDITAAELDNKDGIDVISFAANGNTVVLDDMFVDASDSDAVELANGANTITSLSTNGVSGTVTIGGTGVVTLADVASNAITLKDGVNTSITGGTGDDTITGGSGDDTIALGTGTNTVTGGGGADTVTLSSGTDDVTLGSGNDSVTVALSNLTTADSIDMVSGTDALTVTGGGTKTFSSSFNSQLSNIDSLVTASGGDYTLTMGASYTAITTIDGSGLGSGDVLTVDLSSNSGNFTVTGGAAADSVTLGSGTDTVTLGAGADTFTSASANFKQADDLSGGDDTDTLAFTDQVDITAAELDNKDGIDVISFAANGNTVVLDDMFVDASDSDAVELANGANTITSLSTNGVTGTVTIGGTGTVTLADGVNSKVTLKDSVNTAVVSGTGSDTITGGTGTDTITLGSGNDTINAGSGNDAIKVATSNLTTSDDIDGEGGTDTLTLTGGGSISLTSSFNTQLSNIETLAVAAGSNYTITFGDTYNAILTVDGSALASGNTLIVDISANASNFTATGGDDGDTFTSGEGVFTMTGGTGADTFEYTNEAYSTSSSRDVIADFSGSSGGENDQIDITGFTGSVGTAFIYNPDASFNSVTGEFIVTQSGSHTILQYDSDADASSDWEIQLSNYTDSDFEVSMDLLFASQTGDATDNELTADVDGESLQGLAGADTLTGGNGTDYLYGGDGKDIIDGGAGIDYMYGGAGDDTITYDSAEDSESSLRVHGGSDSETLGLGDILDVSSEFATPDFTIIDDSVYQGIEVINLSGDSVSMTIGIEDVLALSDTTDNLFIEGDESDAVTLDTTFNSWTQGSNATVNNNDYLVYTSDSEDAATVYIDDLVDVTLFL